LAEVSDQKIKDDFIWALDHLASNAETAPPRPLYPDVVAMLESIGERGVPMAIISRHSEETLLDDVAEEGIDIHFDQIIGEPRCDKQLDKTVAIEALCSQYKVDPSEVFYLGDTEHDMRLALKAGVCAIGISHGYDTRVKLEATLPYAVVDSIAEFRALIQV
jgi:phosphoglycolate phosphatase